MDEQGSNSIDQNQSERHKNTFLNKVGSYLGVAYKKMGKAAGELKEKIKKMELGDIIKSSSKKAYLVVKDAGKFVIVKSTPVVEKLKDKTMEGVEKLTQKTKEVYNIYYIDI